MTAEELRAQAITLVSGSDPTGRKRIALDMLYASESGDTDTVARLASEDFHFQFMRRGETWDDGNGKKSSRLNKNDYLKIGVPMVNDLTRDGMYFRVDHVVLEGDIVAIFGESNGVSKAGLHYNNRYCWRLMFSGDKVCDFKEFCDTEHAVQTFFS